MASADGSILIRTKVDTNGIKHGTNAIQSGVGKINNSLLKLGSTIAAVFSVYKLIQFGKEAVNAASQMTNAMIGLKSIVEGTGNSFEQATSFIESYISDGLVPATNAVTAYKNLLMRGYTTEQIEKVMTALKDSAAFGRQASLSLGDAVQSATEGLKNENSILVDNAGVTKNVAKMWEDYAASIGKTANNLTQQEKIQAEVNGILTETRFQTGDAAKVADTWSGKIAVLTFNWNKFLVLVGGRLIQVLTPAINVINSLLVAAINLGNAMANVFGWQVQQSSAAETTAGYVSDTADSESDLADSTAETNKALKKQLAFFDDINVLSSQSAGGASGGTSTGGAVGGGFTPAEQTKKELTKFEKDLLDFFDKVKKAIEPTTEAFKKLWNEGLQLLGKFTYGTLQDFYNDFLVPISKWTFGEGLPRLILAFNDLLKSINWDGLRSALDGFYKAVEPLAENIGEGVLWFIENALNPLAEYVVNEVLITFIEDLTAGIELINTAIDNISPYWDKFWNVFGSDVYSANMEAIGDGILKIFNPLKALNDLVNNFNGQNVIDYFTSIFDLSGILTQPQFALTIEATGQAWGETLGRKLAESFGFTGGLTMSETIDTVFGYLFSLENWNAILGNIQIAFETKWNELVSWWDSVIVMFWETSVFPWFSIEKWTTIGQNMQDGMKAGFKGIVGWIVGVLNGIIDSFESMVNFVVDGANVLIDKFNSLPSAVRLGYTASRFGKVEFGNIKVPALAQGAVLPPNKPFLSVVGDQKSGTNIEAPLDTIKQALAEVMASSGNSGNNTINLNIDGQTFARLFMPSLLNEMSRQGLDIEALGVS